MRFLEQLTICLMFCGILALSACDSSNATSTSQLCFNHVPVSAVQPVGSSISFTVSTMGKTSTFTMPQNAFNGTPAMMKNGDIISFCADQVEIGNTGTITISQFVDNSR